MELLIAFAAAMLIQYAMFIPAYLFKTDKLTDLSYGLSFMLIALIALAYSDLAQGKILLTAMILLWALRLAGYLFLRIHRMKRDERFDGMRESLPRFLGFWTLQGVTVFAVMLASLLYYDGGNGYSVWGIVVFLAGLIIESVADWQKHAFKNDPRNKGRWIDTGLWRLSRHPNYLGEMLVWIGVYAFVLPGLAGIDRWLALISPLFIIFLLLFVSGIPLLQKRADEKWGKDKRYLAYKKSTPILVPYQTLLLCVLACLAAGAIGGLATTTGPGSWYAGIVKPAFNPPNWVFGPVWTTLYVMMGVSLYLAIKAKAGRAGYIAFGAQLALNTLWSLLFFGLESPGMALVCIAALWATIALNIALFWKRSRAAALLLVPYLLWVSFASVLNAAIFLLN